MVTIICVMPALLSRLAPRRTGCDARRILAAAIPWLNACLQLKNITSKISATLPPPLLCPKYSHWK